MLADGLKFPLAKITARKNNPSSGSEEGFVMQFNCIPSAGMIRIRFVGRELPALLSVWDFQGWQEPRKTRRTPAKEQKVSTV